MPRNKPIRIIIDTNLWISFIISNKLNSLDKLLYSDKIKILFSIELVSEIKSTILKPKLKHFFKDSSVEEMFTVFEPYIDFVRVTSNVEVCRDSNDNFLLELAVDGKADFLITGDKDLLDLNKFGNTQIITIAKFIALMDKF